MGELRELIDAAAAARGLSLEALAHEIGVSRATIYNWRAVNPRWFAPLQALIKVVENAEPNP